LAAQRCASLTRTVKLWRRYALANGKDEAARFPDLVFDVLLLELYKDDWAWEHPRTAGMMEHLKCFFGRASDARARHSRGRGVVGPHIDTARVLRRLRALMQEHNVAGKSSPEAALQAGLQRHGGLLTILATQLGQEPKALWFLKEGAFD